MKRYIILIAFFLCWTEISVAQQYVNPAQIGQSGDIVLQNTNVYYTPMAPPDSTDVRDSLSNLGTLLIDPNGVGTGWLYAPRTHGVALQDYKPCDTCAAYGPNAIWQRLFTARDKQDHTHSDIIAGSNVTSDTLHTNGHHGPVVITNNEDVDFRASGTIKLENGFHAMPGSSFHAYIEPRWPSTPVFSDEFTGTTLDLSKWTVANGPDAGYQGKIWPRGSNDTNVRDTTDPDAHDGHAIDVMLREDTGKFLFYDDHWPYGSCGSASDTGKNYYIWSTAIIHSCPWPYTDAGDTTPAYQHAPYGKYEFREKIPHTQHHTNNWGFADEYDLNETWGGNMSQLHPGAGTGRTYGPFTGTFGRKSLTDTTWAFRSSGANWSWSNNPTSLAINGFPFNVILNIASGDTCVYVPGWEHHKFPSSYVNSGGIFSCMYQRSSVDSADKLPWTVTKASDSTWRIFNAGYHIKNGDTLRFSKDYQPTSVTLTYNALGKRKTLSCHWEHTINSPDQGLIYLDSALAPSDLHSFTEAYSYTVSENNYDPTPPYAFDGDDTACGYEYHTFTMELLPNEAIFLFDSNVVMREPDRMVPRSSPFYNAVSHIRRSPVNIFPAESDIDNNGKDSLGIDNSIFWVSPTGDTEYNSPAYAERHYFEEHPHNPGFWDVTIGGKTYHTAHHLLDYVKIWDVPADVKVTPFPQ